ncbi:hypothetical protein LBMAG27_05310 [Bacteroidota bacterium]|nr:hypothetical protein LBMAG27_05310 [Bacteroidota bacterium]
MKKSIYLSIALMFVLSISKAQTAFDFTATDCASVSHTLFTDLDAGKTVVMVWVMPCGSCIGSAVAASNTIATMGNPDVVFYLFDDAGNGSCSSLASWSTTNSITPTATFDNAGNVNPQANYGSGGMPKTVVVGGGTTHTIYFAQNGTVTTTQLQNAINNSISTINGISDFKNVTDEISLYPNPATATTELIYTLTKASSVSIEVFNTLGQKIISDAPKNHTAGKQSFEINTSMLHEGIYFVQLKVDGETVTSKFSVAK